LPRGGRLPDVLQVDVPQVVGLLLLHEGQDQHEKRRIARAARDADRRQRFAHVVIVLHGQADLLEVVGALGTPGRFAGGLHGRQEQRDQDADNRNHDQQLDQRKRRSTVPPHGNAWAHKSPQELDEKDEMRADPEQGSSD
jgi:hypothetical protein